MRAQKPAIVYLLRHGHSTANAKSVLAGRDFKVCLSTAGEKQALAISAELSETKFAKIYSSPLTRCIQTLEPLITKLKIEIQISEGLIEMEYGDWSGKKLALLARNKLWKTIQARPSLVRFPNGESFLEMQSRSLEAVTKLAIPGKSVLLCSHGDVIKAIVASFLGLCVFGAFYIGMNHSQPVNINLNESRVFPFFHQFTKIAFSNCIVEHSLLHIYSDCVRFNTVFFRNTFQYI
jgi:probable phosphoglycerate mutase